MPPATDGFEAKCRSGPPRDRLEVRAVMGKDVLVRGHDRLAGTERRRDERPSRLVAAHDLDHDVHLGIRDEVGRAVGQQVGRDPGRAGAGKVADGDATDRDAAAISGDETVGMREHAIDHGTSHRPGTEQGDTQRRAAHRFDGDGWGA